jgi:predicted RNA-binding Zn-ribbon protein involved in translation (DUF1610 family)
MAKQKCFTVGKAAVDLDKLEVPAAPAPASAPTSRYVRCTSCNWRFRVRGRVGDLVTATCPDCGRERVYSVPEVNVI